MKKTSNKFIDSNNSADIEQKPKKNKNINSIYTV